MPITALYASLLAFVFVVLSVRVIGFRRDARVELGHGESAELLRRMRVHANFAEYVPFAILLMGFAESLKAPVGLIHALGLALIFGRLIHAYGLSQTPQILKYRLLGMVLTITVIGLAAFVCFGLGLLNAAI